MVEIYVKYASKTGKQEKMFPKPRFAVMRTFFKEFGFTN